MHECLWALRPEIKYLIGSCFILSHSNLIWKMILVNCQPKACRFPSGWAKGKQIEVRGTGSEKVFKRDIGNTI